MYVAQSVCLIAPFMSSTAQCLVSASVHFVTRIVSSAGPERWSDAQAVRQIQGSICLDSLGRFIKSIEPSGPTEIKQWGMRDLENFFQAGAPDPYCSCPGWTSALALVPEHRAKDGR